MSYFSIQLGISPSRLTVILFRGVAQPPTRFGSQKSAIFETRILRGTTCFPVHFQWRAAVLWVIGLREIPSPNHSTSKGSIIGRREHLQEPPWNPHMYIYNIYTHTYMYIYIYSIYIYTYIYICIYIMSIPHQYKPCFFNFWGYPPNSDNMILSCYPQCSTAARSEGTPAAAPAAVRRIGRTWLRTWINHNI